MDIDPVSARLPREVSEIVNCPLPTDGVEKLVF
jgi:hypothetical protein